MLKIKEAQPYEPEGKITAVERGKINGYIKEALHSQGEQILPNSQVHIHLRECTEFTKFIADSEEERLGLEGRIRAASHRMPLKFKFSMDFEVNGEMVLQKHGDVLVEGNPSDPDISINHCYWTSRYCIFRSPDDLKREIKSRKHSPRVATPLSVIPVARNDRQVKMIKSNEGHNFIFTLGSPADGMPIYSINGETNTAVVEPLSDICLSVVKDYDDDNWRSWEYTVSTPDAVHVPEAHQIQAPSHATIRRNVHQQIGDSMSM